MNAAIEDLFGQQMPSISTIAGTDEAGRGALVGAVYAAAVILPEKYDLPLLNDSKKLSSRQREKLAVAIQEQALAYAVASATAAEIDQYNIHHASLLAMQRAIAALPRPPQQVWADGRFAPACACPSRAFVHGDALYPCISAASILAKVARDASMQALDALYPDYGFAKHKGYPTAEHLSALVRLGACPQHRRSYAPVRQVLSLSEL